MKKLLFITLFLCVIPIYKLSCFTPQTGDIVFQDGSQSNFNDAVKNVTESWEGRNFSHCGIVVVDTIAEKQEIYIIEALHEGVVATPLDAFLKRNLDKNNNPKVTVGRLNDSLLYSIPLAIKNAKNMIGADYDFAFDFDNDKYYCSELVYFAFLNKAHKPIFETNPMTFVNPNTKTTDPKWIEYFNKLGVNIPEGKEGINPGGISLSKSIKIIYSYY